MLDGIETEKVGESYTSGILALELESINKENYDKKRRFVTGLSKSKSGPLINSDVNGFLNILRKYLKDECIPRPIALARDNGILDNLKRIRVV